MNKRKIKKIKENKLTQNYCEMNGKENSREKAPGVDAKLCKNVNLVLLYSNHFNLI